MSKLNHIATTLEDRLHEKIARYVGHLDRCLLAHQITKIEYAKAICEIDAWAKLKLGKESS